MIPLGLLSAGELGEIVEVMLDKANGAGCPSELDKSVVRAEDLGLRVGKSVEVLANGGNNILLKVDESRIAIARRMAMKIMVRR